MSNFLVETWREASGAASEMILDATRRRFWTKPCQCSRYFHSKLQVSSAVP